MKLSLKTKVMVFVAAVVIFVTAISTFLSISAHRKSSEREVSARGVALSEALARSVDEGLAAENLNLIKHVADIVHTGDVLLTQVFSTLWLGVASDPPDQLNSPPSPAAIDYFKTHKGDHDSYHELGRGWLDVYHTIVLDPHDARVPKVLIGFVRLRISTEQASRAIRKVVLENILAGLLVTIISVIFLNAIIMKYVLAPVLALHASIAKHREGDLPVAVPVHTADEIGELSVEFNQMSVALREREERLAEEKERLAVTLRSIGDAVIVTDVQGVITLLNKVAEQLTGWTSREAAGRPLAEVFHIVNEKTRERCGNPAQKVVESGHILGLANHTALIKKDGSEIAIEDSAAPIRDRHSVVIGVVLVFRDATEKKRIEEEHFKVEKLESVGVLAGGLAHDFNNLLTSIVGNISLAKMYVDTNSKAYARLADAEIASRRATDLTYQLLTFSKGGAPVKQAASIVDILRESTAFTLSGTTIAPEFRISGDIWTVDVDAGQMSQVFNNLIINAVQAMPDGGKIVLSVANIVLAEHEASTLRAGPHVKISIQDTGGGIPAEHLARIFDPYFTTKQTGSGLGLSSSYSIIKRHDGHIAVESKRGQGSIFTIYLPASQDVKIQAPLGQGDIAIGHGKVLVMDDEQIIRDLSEEILRSLGYEVELAKNGAEALAKYQQALDAKRPFDVVIMDLTIPGGMGGKETIQKLRNIDPLVKGIVSSGYSNDPIMADYAAYGFKGVITKPYSVESFSRSLSDVMQG